MGGIRCDRVMLDMDGLGSVWYDRLFDRFTKALLRARPELDYLELDFKNSSSCQ